MSLLFRPVYSKAILSSELTGAESLVPWGRLLFQVLNLRIPANAVPVDEEERERSEWWKAKKWACGILGRLFHRYGVYYRSHISRSGRRTTA
ncbi:hypothetical protein BGY98DRAFT_993901, partial [Russula aff. rugulosa BPL654]